MAAFPDQPHFMDFIDRSNNTMTTQQQYYSQVDTIQSNQPQNLSRQFQPIDLQPTFSQQLQRNQQQQCQQYQLIHQQQRLQHHQCQQQQNYQQIQQQHQLQTASNQQSSFSPPLEQHKLSISDQSTNQFTFNPNTLSLSSIEKIRQYFAESRKKLRSREIEFDIKLSEYHRLYHYAYPESTPEHEFWRYISTRINKEVLAINARRQALDKIEEEFVMAVEKFKKQMQYTQAMDNSEFLTPPPTPVIADPGGIDLTAIDAHINNFLQNELDRSEISLKPFTALDEQIFLPDIQNTDNFDTTKCKQVSTTNSLTSPLDIHYSNRSSTSNTYIETTESVTPAENVTHDGILGDQHTSRENGICEALPDDFLSIFNGYFDNT